MQFIKFVSHAIGVCSKKCAIGIYMPVAPDHRGNGPGLERCRGEYLNGIYTCEFIYF